MMEVLRQLGRDQRDYEVEKCKLMYLSMYNNLNKMEVKFLYKNNNKMIKPLKELKISLAHGNLTVDRSSKWRIHKCL